VNLLKGYQEAVRAVLASQKELDDRSRALAGSLGARLRETSQRLKDMGCFLPLPPPSNDGPWAVDGAYAATRRLGDAVAIVAVAAAPEKGAPLAAGEVHLIPHTPESEFLLRARMIMLELLAAVELVKTKSCPVLLDGSFGSSLVMVNQALRMGSRVDQSLWQIVESLVELWAEALELVAFEGLPIVALPKLTSGYRIAPRMGLDLPMSDRALLSLLLSPGTWTSEARLYAALGVEIEEKGRFRFEGPLDETLKKRLERVASALQSRVENAYVRLPEPASVALAIEYCCSAKEAVALLHGTLPSPRLQEPLLLVAADEAAKSLCSLLQHLPQGQELWQAPYRSSR